MELIIAILMCLHVMATPDQLTDPTFNERNREALDRTQIIIDHHNYHVAEGGVVIVDEVTV